MSLQYKISAVIIALIVAFCAGVKVANWHNDSVELSAQKAAEKVAEKFQVDQKAIATNVSTSLSEWRQSNVIVQEKIVREKLQPVFSNECLSPEYQRLFNEQTNSRAASGSGKPTAKAGN
ncbi:hypothetical protein [Pectobacterium phage Wc4-1]|uniref:Uncharacterized protein n=1 Tax=Pectobacterium phage Wc4 TaxID=2652428 RepID=A0A5P8D4F6_9CAUD|nr:hypothetical protein [Pectobacterium phage Wc4]QFP94028.1 hypothetical protein [Pectobacterium phage Wc4-1]